jgi:WD40 repeat protein
MAEWNRSPGEQAAQLDSLFAQLRQQNGNSASSGPGSSMVNQLGSEPSPYFAQSQQQHHAYNQPFTSPPIHTQFGYTPHSRHSSAVLSPTGEIPQPQQRPMVSAGGGSSSNADRTASLLNLLKFSQPAPATTQISQSSPPHAIGREREVSQPLSSGRGAPDLLATLMGATHTKENQQPAPQILSPAHNTAVGSEAGANAPSTETQAYLLQLLNRPKPAQIDPKPHHESVKPSSSSTKSNSRHEVIDLTKALEDTSISKGPEQEPALSQAAPKSTLPIFTYVNPFEQLAASSPRNRTPKSATPVQSTSTTPAMQILKPPRHMGSGSSELKRKVDQDTVASSPAHKERKLHSTSSTPSPLPDGRSQIEALIGIGASGKGKGKETVAEALSEVGDQVDKEVEEAIARAEKDESDARAEANNAQVVIEKDIETMMDAKTDAEFELSAQIAALDIKKELEKAGNEHVLEEAVPAPVAEVVKELIDDAAEGRLADSWESADAEDSPFKEDELETDTRVYNFPLKPFISIILHPNGNELPEFRADSFMDIARVKKDFDQIDRTLVAASNNFIVFAMKNAGFRVIRQIDGRDDKLFTETKDRIFHVSLCNSATDATETMIGIGVSGTVYWAPASSSDGEPHIARTGAPSSEKFGFALPPFKAMGEESSGGVVKTRARKSCSHPEFFAVGRGKSIHIIWPSVITKQGYLKPGPERVVDIEKYLNHRSLKINTGKAGKDFAFSHDDTTVVSLDKAGKVKFWDVRTLTNNDRGTESRYPTPEQIQPVEINEPLMTLVTTPATEKSWPTSVLLIDKLRAYQKGGALRYLIVGQKQNHTLQLWDLALGKQVQELQLPHENESDAVCSVVFHPATGMIVVGHPTRNSIYLIHLSAPRYNIQKTISQAEFAERLAAGDASLPKPDATAVMSGIREYSFANKGVLRSLDIVADPITPDPLDPTLFELYAMHSKGVTCINIKQRDLGWNKEMKVMYPVNAEEQGMISVEALKPIPVDGEIPTGTPGAKTIASRGTIKEATPKESPRKGASSLAPIDLTRTPEAPGGGPSLARTAMKHDSPHTPMPNGGAESPAAIEKADKKKKKKQAAALARGNAENVVAQASTSPDMNNQAPPRVPSPPEIPKDDSGEQSASQNVAKKVPVAKTLGDSSSASGVVGGTASNIGLSQASIDAIINKMQTNVSSEVSNLITGSLDDLYRRFDDDKRTQAAVADAKQDAMLRLISSTLSDNVEKTLADIVSTNIKKSVLPVITDGTMKAVNDQLNTTLGSVLKSALPTQLQRALPEVIAKALTKPEVVKLMSESLAKSVAFRVEEHFAGLLKTHVTPAFTNLAVQTAQQAGLDIQRQAMEIIGRMENERRVESMKIDQLTRLVTGLSETVSTMAAAQSQFQEEILKVQQAAHVRQFESERSDAGGVRRMSSAASQGLMPSEHDDSLDRLISEVASLVNAGDIDAAFMRAIKEDRLNEVFERYFSQFDPAMIRGINPLMLLSVGVTLSSQFEGHLILERVAWVEATLLAYQASIENLVSDQT